MIRIKGRTAVYGEVWYDEELPGRLCNGDRGSINGANRNSTEAPAFRDARNDRHRDVT